MAFRTVQTLWANFVTLVKISHNVEIWRVLEKVPSPVCVYIPGILDVIWYDFDESAW